MSSKTATPGCDGAVSVVRPAAVSRLRLSAYYDATNPQGSVVVAGTGTTIEVVQSNSTGMLTLQVR